MHGNKHGSMYPCRGLSEGHISFSLSLSRFSLAMATSIATCTPAGAYNKNALSRSRSHAALEKKEAALGSSTGELTRYVALFSYWVFHTHL